MLLDHLLHHHHHQINLEPQDQSHLLSVVSTIRALISFGWCEEYKVPWDVETHKYTTVARPEITDKEGWGGEREGDINEIRSLAHLSEDEFKAGLCVCVPRLRYIRPELNVRAPLQRASLEWFEVYK